MTTRPRRSLASNLRIIALVIIAAAVTIFALANMETVKVNLMFARVETPRFLLIFIVFFAGAAVGWLSRTRRKPKA